MNGSGILIEFLIRLGLYAVIAILVFMVSRVKGMSVLKWDFDDVRKSGMTAILCVGVAVLLGSLYLFACTLKETPRAANVVEMAKPQPSPEFASLEDVFPVLDSCTAADAALIREMAFAKECVTANGPAQGGKSGSVTRNTHIVTGKSSQLILTLLLVFPVLAAVKLLREHWGSSGLTRHNLLPSVMIGLVVGGLAGIIMLALRNNPATLTGNHVTLLLFYAFVGFGEEVVFRGYVQTRLIGWFGRTSGWLGASLLMVLVHLSQRLAVLGASPVEALGAALLLLPFSLLLGYLMLRTGNVVAPGLTHSLAGWVSAL